MPKKPARFIAQYNYSFALLPDGEGNLFERRRFKRFITSRQHKAFLARFRSAWRGFRFSVNARGFLPGQPS